MKSILHHFERAFIETNKRKLFGRWNSDLKIWYIFNKTSVLSVISNKCDGNGENIFNERVKTWYTSDFMILFNI